MKCIQYRNIIEKRRYAQNRKLPNNPELNNSKNLLKINPKKNKSNSKHIAAINGTG